MGDGPGTAFDVVVGIAFVLLLFGGMLMGVRRLLLRMHGQYPPRDQSKDTPRGFDVITKDEISRD